MYKLIALDCDGTLLTSRKEITDRTAAALDASKAKGLKILLASARPFYRLRPFLEKLGLVSDDQYTIAFNGGLIVSNTESKVLFSGGFSDPQVEELVSIGSSYNTAMFLYSRDSIYSNVNDEKYKARNPDVNFNVVDFASTSLSGIQIYKIAYVNTPDKTLLLRERLPKELGEKYEISSSVPQFVEFVRKGITKSGALKYVGRNIGILAHEMIAFGDQDNDVPMLSYVGLSIAMGNASDAVKRCADYVTASNDEDGIALALESLLQL